LRSDSDSGIASRTRCKRGGVFSKRKVYETTAKGELRQMDRIAPSARLEAQIEELLGDELAANSKKLAELRVQPRYM
jgi:hypothetical protein